MKRLAINGFGRIGRCVLRALMESTYRDRLQVVAINELAEPDTIRYLTSYDTTHGRFPGDVALKNGSLCVDGNEIKLSHCSSVADLPWAEQGIDLVFECTGAFSDRVTASQHLDAGASRVLFSQPAERDVDATIVFGLNEALLSSEMRIVSAASCTTNAVTPVIDCLHRAFGIESGMIRTIHAAMHDQPVIDAYHSRDLRKTRAAFESLIPVSTELALGVERVLPDLQGRFAATAMRVPVSDVSAIDLSVYLERSVTLDELRRQLREASSAYQGVLGYCEEPLVSCDFVHDAHSAVIDAAQTTLAGDRLVKILIWFDNEWGYANRMLDVALKWLNDS